MSLSSIIGTFKNKNVGLQFIDVSNIILNGQSCLNYNIINPPSFLSEIYKLGIKAIFTSMPKIYDNNNNATLNTFGTLSGILGIDTVNITSYNAYYQDYRTGKKLIDISNIIIGNSDALNYYILPILPCNGYILPKAIDISFSLVNKKYDGTKIVLNLNMSLTNILGLDIVSISSYTSLFKSNQVGYQLIDISSLIIKGIDANNYYVPPIQSYFGYIRPKNLIINYIESNQTYTGFTYNNYNVSYNGLVKIDSNLSLSGTLGYAITTNNSNINKLNIVNWLVLLSDLNQILYSIDGTNWYNCLYNGIIGLSIGYNNLIWIILGTGLNTIAYSYDGINWVGIGLLIFSIKGLSVKYTGKMWIAVGEGINSIAYSYYGLIWIGLGVTIFTTRGWGIYNNNNIIIAVGEGLNTIAYSYSGLSWVGLGMLIFDIKGTSIVNNGIIWVALGKGSINNMAYSYNGLDWFGLGQSTFTDIGNYCIWDGNKFIAVGAGLNTLAYSYDGIKWTGLGQTIFTNSGLSISFNGQLYIAIGSGTNTAASSLDGINWVITNITNINNPCAIESVKSINYLYTDQIIDAGVYNIIPGGLYSKNYNITYIPGNTNIFKAKLLIRHNNIYQNYNSYAFNNFKITLTGLLCNDTDQSLTGTIKYNYNSDLTKVGYYNITLSGLTSNNYDITYLPGNLQIIKSKIIIKVINNVKVYDKLVYTPSYVIYGLMSNDTLSSLSGILNFDGSYINAVNSGYYDIIANGLYSSNYNINYISGVIQIVKSPLYIIANNDNKIYYNDISNYLLVYDSSKFKLLNNISVYNLQTITSKYKDSAKTLIWSLNGYEGHCLLSFNPPSYLSSIGLSIINSDTGLSKFEQYIINTDQITNGYKITVNELNGIYNYNCIIQNNVNTIISIKYINNSINYYVNNTLFRSTIRSTSLKLYLNIRLYNINDIISNIRFNTIKNYYIGGNGFYCTGFKGDDTIDDLNGLIIYSGTSQNASETGKYTIIPSGFSSDNYDITYIIGYLDIKKSIQI